MVKETEEVWIKRCEWRSDPAAGQLVEHLLVQRLVLVLGARGQEDVAADELVHHFAVHLRTDERQAGLVRELHRDLPCEREGLEVMCVTPLHEQHW